ncbi:ultraviolet-B receptor UVR8 [Euphorbia lathyris]|uniref:ultraviolet-B receptor UVR8 n=1 Tax=Euphorbia lathyris TaxID=212925 RepID=UPI003313513F
MDDNRVGALSGSSNLSNKVLTVAIGEAHTLALTGDGCVYTWGRGMFGRLGTGSEADELCPVRVKFDTSEEKKLKFVGIAAGAYHSLALADDGSVWCWGYNIYGQLGINDDFSMVPRLMDHFLDSSSLDSITNESETKRREPLKVCSVKAGGMMSIAIDNLGILWMWGNCPHNRNTTESVPVSSLESTFTPIPVQDFYGRTVVKVACGNQHVVALVSAGETYKGEDLVCYSWGDNNHGQLGLGDRESRIRPDVVETFNHDSPWAVYDIACGAYHTALLSVKKSPNGKIEYTCWTFGLGDNGQLGHGTTQSAVKPEPVKELPQHVYLISTDCGLFHTSVVSSTGDVWSWGMMNGLGLCPDASFTGTDAGDAISPRKITLERPKFHDPVQISCGAAHTVLVANGGYKLWSWGRGQSGVLGNGKTMDILGPSLLLWPPLEDFKDQDSNNVTEDKLGNNGSEDVGETEKRLALAMEEMKLLQSKLSIVERYASILHGSIFGKPFAEEDIPISLRNEGTFDIAKEWEDMLDSADRSKLIRLELFYRNMLAGVKDKQMKRRIQEMIKEFLPPSTSAKTGENSVQNGQGRVT